MKKYLKISLISLMIFSAISCEEFLETESKSTFTEGTVFTNLDFATKAVYGIYDNIASYWMYTYHMGLFWKCDNDIEMSFSSDDGSKKSIAHYAATEGSGGLDRVWNTIYQTIERANICIDNLPLSPIWEGEYEDEAKRLYGEAVALRAHLYYELIMLWGDVPFAVSSTQAGDDYYLPKTDRDEIYEYLIQDLKDVEDFVPWMSETAERVNKAFVKGLRARMALAYAGYSLRNGTLETRRGRNWEEYYQIANQECKEILESNKHELNPNFKEIFKTLHSYSQEMNYKEILFEVAYTRLYSGRVGYSIGMKHHNNDKVYGKAAGEISVAPSYFYSFDKKDKRRNVSVELYDYGSSSNLGKQNPINGRKPSSYRPCKWRMSWLSPTAPGISYTGVNWPIMRYSDVILMLAESENEINGPTQLAKDALAMVRERAFAEEYWDTKVTQYVDSVAGSKESFFNAIVDERAWELGGEMIRKYDLVRWNLLSTKINEMKEECLKMINGDPEYSYLPTNIFWQMENDEVTILNPDYLIDESSVSGYSRTAWIGAMKQWEKNDFIRDLDRVAHGLDPAKNNHLLPIHGEIISASNGILANDQIP